MSTLKSSSANLTLNADGSGNDIKFQSNAVEVGSLTAEGVLTATSFAGSGSNLTGISSGPFTEVNANKFTYTTATNPVLQVIDSTNTVKAQMQGGNTSAVFGSASDHPVNFIAGAAETTVGIIDITGAWTKPLQPAFQVRPDGVQQNVPINQWNDMEFDTEAFDQNADFNTTNYTFTAPVTGKYQLNFVCRGDQIDTAAMYHHFRMNTSNRIYYSIMDFGLGGTDPIYWTFNIAVLADMDANDTAKMEVYQAAGTAQMDIEHSFTFFSGYLAC